MAHMEISMKDIEYNDRHLCIIHQHQAIIQQKCFLECEPYMITITIFEMHSL